MSQPLRDDLPPVNPAAPDTLTNKPEVDRPLQPGDLAPPLTGVSWIRHAGTGNADGPATLERGTVYVLDFWATWCGPCISLMPHMSDIAEAYKDKGVRVLGVSIWENSRALVGAGSYAERVAKFVQGRDGQLKYAVGYAGDDSVLPTTWMAAARRVSIPTVFVVDKGGKVAWIGHPSAGLEDVLDAVLEGNFNAADWDFRSREMEKRRREGIVLQTPLQQALQSGEYDKAIGLCDRMLAIDKRVFAPAAATKFNLLLTKLGRKQEAYALAAKLTEEYGKEAVVHGQIARTILFDAAADDRDLGVADAAIVKARELTRGRDVGVESLEAESLFLRGKASEAILKAQGALAKPVDDFLRDQLEKQLTRFRAVEPSSLLAPGGG